MATSFIGKPISLISHSDVRYRGILAGIDATNSTIQLQNVYSMGTENRRPPDEYMPPAEQPFQYIIFRASEVKDLAVDMEQPISAPRRSVHDDPAILRSGPLPMDNGYGQYPQYAQQPIQHEAPQMPRQQQPISTSNRPPSNSHSMAPAVASASVPTTSVPVPSNAPVNTMAAAVDGRTSSRASSGANGRRSNANSVQTAAASLETVERALGDLRVSNAHARSNGTRRNGRGQEKDNKIQVPATDFDFEKSNALFNKSAIAPRSTSAAAKGEDERTNPSDEEKDGTIGGQMTSHKEKEKETESAYNPKKSFFDSLSSSASTQSESRGGRGGGGGRRGMGRSRREEEREKNVATFGEAGVKLMGPGSYVGGYGRRGGRGGRRGSSTTTGR